MNETKTKVVAHRLPPVKQPIALVEIQLSAYAAKLLHVFLENSLEPDGLNTLHELKEALKEALQ